MGEGKFNLNALKEIKVTESYIGLDESVKDCQTEEAIEDCETRNYINAVLHQCECLPLSIRINTKVHFLIFKKESPEYFATLGPHLHPRTTGLCAKYEYELNKLPSILRRNHDHWLQ